MVTPGVARFGTVEVGGRYELSVMIKNEDCQLMRFTIRQPRDLAVKVVYTPKPLAPGMDLRVIVDLQATSIGLLDT